MSTLVAQKQKSDKYSAELNVYQQKLAEYNKAMERWRGTNPLNPNGLTTAEVKQHLTLGREPQAKLNLTNINPSLIFRQVWDASGDPRTSTDSAAHEYTSHSDISGTVVTATFTNLKNSYYVDNNGRKQAISKIVRNFTNLKKLPSENEALLSIYEDPTDGFWYNNSSEITVTDTYYDANGQAIYIDGNGWLAATSLNAVYGGANEAQTLSGTPAHVETVRPIQGGKSYALAGSSISVHSDGSLYADRSNTATIMQNGEPDPAFTKAGVSTWPDGKPSWDAKGPNEYYGAGLIKLTGSSITMNFKSTITWNGTVWATLSTIIPQTPTPEYNVPKIPTLETSTASYHYNVTTADSLSRCTITFMRFSTAVRIYFFSKLFNALGAYATVLFKRDLTVRVICH